MDTIANVKEKIVEIVKREYACGMVNMFEGNVSAKIGDRYFITPSQVGKLDMTPEMVIEVDKDGNLIDGLPGLKPTTETKMHLKVYELRPDVCAVVHNHSTYATAYAMNNMPITSDSLTEPLITLGPVPVCPYGTPGSDRIYAGFPELIGDHNAMLLANHGLIAFAPDLETAFSYAEAAEKVAKQIFISKLLGTPNPIPKEEYDGLVAYGQQIRQFKMNASIQAQEEAKNK